jgi:hypothetical protein
MGRNRCAPREGWIELVDAARLLAVGYYVAYNWALTGHLKAERVGGHWYVALNDVERLERERTQTHLVPSRSS